MNGRMVRTRTKKRHSCPLREKRFADKPRAQGEAERLIRLGARAIPYRCPYADHWHVSTSKPVADA